ncbi:MAG TPA: PIG-L deacetylase family protein [Acidimicrobiales bacterium]|jgi:LmbE family N-acetylglucosaminyl deacetylase|nr:PIG-L deacetylase family protein [Acidimicrobiales bacterium]
MDEIPAVALAVYAHPDDADVACGGTLARWAKAGSAVHLLVCTDGGKGTFDAAVEPAQLAAERAAELEQSSAVIGLTGVANLGYPDGELVDSDDFRQILVEWVRRLRPDVVCGHDPTAVFFGQAYFNHRDHRIAGTALLDAVSPAAALPHYFPAAGPPHQVATVLLSGTLEPDVWVDVTDTIEAKAAAVECHRTQFADPGGWAGDAVRRRAEEEGRRAGTQYAEGFRRLTLRG